MAKWVLTDRVDFERGVYHFLFLFSWKIESWWLQTQYANYWAKPAIVVIMVCLCAHFNVKLMSFLFTCSSPAGACSTTCGSLWGRCPVIFLQVLLRVEMWGTPSTLPFEAWNGHEGAESGGKWWLQMLNFSMIFEICHKMLAKNDILHVHHSASICCWSIPAIVNCQLGMDPCCGCLSFNLRQQRTHESFGLGWLTSGSMFLRDSHCFIKLCIS